MSRHTRRRFLAQTAAAGVLGWRTLRAQAPQPVPIPGLQAGEPTKSFALRNVTVIDATGKPALPGMTVVIADNRIQSLGATASTTLAPGVQAVDVSGKFLIPGLWDMHVHDWFGEISPLFIPNGVTGVRTMGGSPAVATMFVQRRVEIANGKRLGPRLVVGPTLNGVSDEAMADAVKRGIDVQRFSAGMVLTAEQGRLAVRAAVQRGADCDKRWDATTWVWRP